MFITCLILHLETPAVSPPLVWFHNNDYHQLDPPSLELNWDPFNLTMRADAKVNARRIYEWRAKWHCMYWFAGLISSEWLTQQFRLDVIEYISNEFQHKLKRDLSFIKVTVCWWNFFSLVVKTCSPHLKNVFHYHIRVRGAV